MLEQSAVQESEASCLPDELRAAAAAAAPHHHQARTQPKVDSDSNAKLYAGEEVSDNEVDGVCLRSVPAR